MVTIYTTPTCPYCKAAKAFLKKKGVSFTEKDVSENESNAKEMEEKSEQRSVPVIDIDGKILIDFDEKKLSQALNIK